MPAGAPGDERRDGGGTLPTAAAPTRQVHGLFQWGLSYSIGRAYSMSAGPRIRQAVQKLLGQPYTEPFIAPLTPGYVAREVAMAGAGFLVGNTAFKWMMQATGESTKGMNTLISAIGATGVNAGAAAGATSAAAAHAFRMMVARNFGMVAVATAMDAVFAAKVGPWLELRVNRMFGIDKSTTVTDIRGGVPLSAVKQTFEEATRAFTRSFLGGIIFTVGWKEAGIPVARMVLGSIGGTHGAVAGALAGAIVTAAINHTVIWAFATQACDIAQKGVRLIKKQLGKPLDPWDKHRDVISTMGDRVSGVVGGVLIPFGVASATGQRGAFIKGLVPAGR